MSANRVLVAGGAGYVGSHACLALAANGFTPVVYDNLSKGHRQLVQWGPFEEGDIRDRDRLQAVFQKHRPIGVMHFAASTAVDGPTADPASLYDNDVTGTLTLLSAARAAGITRLVFSSTCATYGMPGYLPLDEDHPQAPANPHGRTKWIVEQALNDLGRYSGLHFVCLRYFNAAGADSQGRIGEWHEPETHAIPLAISAALGKGEGFTIFGADYPTRDGTCIRDYVHVCDLADAHVKALNYLLGGGAPITLNLGTGTGSTVNELIEAVRLVSCQNFPVTVTARRDGDPHSLVADNRRARTVLGWKPHHDLTGIVDSAWNWHLRHAGELHREFA